MSSWHVIQVMSGQEAVTRILIEKWIGQRKKADRERTAETSEISLKADGLEAERQAAAQSVKPLVEACIIPLKEREKKFHGSWHLVTERVYPGYLFLKTEDAEQLFFQLKQIPKLTKLLGDAELTFDSLTDEEAAFVENLGGAEHVVQLSPVAVDKDGNVTVLGGELKKYEERIKKIDLHKRIAVVRTTIGETEKEIYLGIVLEGETGTNRE